MAVRLGPLGMSWFNTTRIDNCGAFSSYHPGTTAPRCSRTTRASVRHIGVARISRWSGRCPFPERHVDALFADAVEDTGRLPAFLCLLTDAGRHDEASRLRLHWEKKVTFLVTGNQAWATLSEHSEPKESRKGAECLCRRPPNVGLARLIPQDTVLWPKICHPERAIRIRCAPLLAATNNAAASRTVLRFVAS